MRIFSNLTTRGSGAREKYNAWFSPNRLPIFRTSLGTCRIGRRFSGQKQGHVYVAVVGETGLAVKAEKCDISNGPVLHEGHVHNVLAAHGSLTGIPHVYYIGSTSSYRLIATERLGRNMEQYRITCGGKFSLKSVLIVAMKAVRALQSFHDVGLMHCNVGPRNFMAGRYIRNEGDVFIIDYARVQRFCSHRVLDDGIELAQSATPTHITEFSSISYDNGRKQCPMDDLESLGYTLVYLFKGKLPWKSNWISSRKKTGALTRKKENTCVNVLCEGLPQAFSIFMRYIHRNCGSTLPNHDYLSSLFENTYFTHGFEDDCQFDWHDIPHVGI